MKKKYIIIAICLMLTLVPLFANEGESDIHLSYGTGIFTSRLGVDIDKGRWEFGMGVDSGFPNLFLSALVSDSDEEILDLLWDSITLFYGATIHSTFDVIPSPNHDLDLGLSLEGVYTNIFNNKLLVFMLSAKLRYAYNFNNGFRLFVETFVPTVNYSKNFTGSDKGSFGISILEEDVLYPSLLFGTKLGCSFTF